MAASEKVDRLLWVGRHLPSASAASDDTANLHRRGEFGHDPPFDNPAQIVDNTLARRSCEVRFQVIADGPDRSDLEKAIGHRVQVAGVPVAPLTRHHRTALLFDVKSLKPVDAWHR